MDIKKKTDGQNKNKCKTSYLQRPGQVKNTEATSKEKTKARYKSKKKKKKKRSKMQILIESSKMRVASLQDNKNHNYIC